MSRFKIDEEVAVSDIALIDKNARFMQQSDFRQLVANIKRDGQLSSIPFCVKKENGGYIVVSGNHRVQAAKQAGLNTIPVMYVEEENITHDQIRAIQLSHNSIAGQDDPEILKQLLDEIRDTAFKEYAHISQEYLNSIESPTYVVEMPNNEIVPVTFMFIDTNKVSFDRVMAQLDLLTPRELENTTLIPKDVMHRLNEVSAKVQEKHKIKAQALSICKMIELVDYMLDNGTAETDA